jgi:hypothetical protein
MALSEKARFVADYFLRVRRYGPISLQGLCADACRAWELIQTADNDAKKVDPLSGDIKWRPMSELSEKREPSRYILVWSNIGPDLWISSAVAITELMLAWAEIKKPEGIK